MGAAIDEPCLEHGKRYVTDTPPLDLADLIKLPNSEAGQELTEL